MKVAERSAFAPKMAIHKHTFRDAHFAKIETGKRQKAHQKRRKEETRGILFPDINSIRGVPRALWSRYLSEF